MTTLPLFSARRNLRPAQQFELEVGSGLADQGRFGSRQPGRRATGPRRPAPPSARGHSAASIAGRRAGPRPSRCRRRSGADRLPSGRPGRAPGRRSCRRGSRRRAARRGRSGGFRHGRRPGLASPRPRPVGCAVFALRRARRDGARRSRASRSRGMSFGLQPDLDLERLVVHLDQPAAEVVSVPRADQVGGRILLLHPGQGSVKRSRLALLILMVVVSLLRQLNRLDLVVGDEGAGGERRAEGHSASRRCCVISDGITSPLRR